MVWFRMSVGRRNNADPRWLLPIICRLGHVTKKEIGPIRIFDRETKFGIVKSHATKFASAARKTNDEDIRIEPAGFEPSEARNGKKKPPKGKVSKKDKKFPPSGKASKPAQGGKRKGD